MTEFKRPFNFRVSEAQYNAIRDRVKQYPNKYPSSAAFIRYAVQRCLNMKED